MAAEPQQSPFRRLRPRWSLIGVACLATTSLGAYLVLIGFGAWHTAVRRRVQLPISTDVAQGATTITVSPQAVETSPRLESVGAELTALQSSTESNSPNRFGVHFPIQDPRDAAEFAATAANDECLRIWRRAPFAANMYPATMVDGWWHWGGYDPFGPDGFSAEVSFGHRASSVKVQINFSTDAVDWNVAE